MQIKLLLILDTSNQDIQLGEEIDAVLLGKGWSVEYRFTYAYTRTISREQATTDLASLIIADVESAVLQAEWPHVRYLYAVGDKGPEFGFARGN